jgi:hypothetical protein
MKRFVLGTSQRVDAVALASILPLGFAVMTFLKPSRPAMTIGLAAVFVLLGIVGKHAHEAYAIVTEHRLVVNSYGPLWPGVRIPRAAIARLTEHRISDGKGEVGPVWALVVDFKDGSRRQFGAWTNPHVHELIHELNVAVRELPAQSRP